MTDEQLTELGEAWARAIFSRQGTAAGLAAMRKVLGAQAAPVEPVAQPIGYMSPKQVRHIVDPEDRSGAHIPMRKTPAGNFTMALYATPQAQPATPPAVQAPQWPKARDVGRMEDMNPSGHLRVGLDGDNDVYVSAFNGEHQASVEFCNGGGGGGRSTRTRMALIALMAAMEADNAERPDLDWWALRNGAAAQGGEHE